MYVIMSVNKLKQSQGFVKEEDQTHSTVVVSFWTTTETIIGTQKMQAYW